jgi:hypothetical protein
MPTTAKPPHATQLPLLQSPRSRLPWERIPLENRQEVEQLLARLLREHASRNGEFPETREGVGHE